MQVQFIRYASTKHRIFGGPGPDTSPLYPVTYQASCSVARVPRGFEVYLIMPAKRKC